MRSLGQADLRYETPETVARVIARHVPKRGGTLLDPCVGRGCLIKPVMRYMGERLQRTVCVDTSEQALDEFSSGLDKRTRRMVTCINANFLELTQACGPHFGGQLFDCVVMNPPFLAKKQDHVIVDELGQGRGKHVAPVEAAFIVRGVELLKPGGRLLAVLPPSVISGASAEWLRLRLMKEGAVLYVHELPAFTFRDVESRVYLFVYEKSSTQRKIVLLNHDLMHPHRLLLDVHACASPYRFDFNYQATKSAYQRIVHASPTLEWGPLCDIADVFRGTEMRREDHDSILHTDHLKKGFWETPKGECVSPTSMARVTATAGDILGKRVGRGCASSFGKYAGADHRVCTDCLFIVRPKPTGSTAMVLLSMRIVSTSHWGRAQLEQGTGAAYISGTSLKRMLVPTVLDRRFPRLSAQYHHAVEIACFRTMVRIESRIRTHLERDARLVTSNGCEEVVRGQDPIGASRHRALR